MSLVHKESMAKIEDINKNIKTPIPQVTDKAPVEDDLLSRTIQGISTDRKK